MRTDFGIADQICAIQGELAAAKREKGELEASLANLGSVDKSVIEALKVKCTVRQEDLRWQKIIKRFHT